jgi:hypothetical protein
VNNRNKLYAHIEAHASDYVPASESMSEVDKTVALMSIALSLKKIADLMDAFYENGFIVKK